MKIFSLRPMSNWDRASNLIRIMTESSSSIERTSKGLNRYGVPGSKISGMADRSSASTSGISGKVQI